MASQEEVNSSYISDSQVVSDEDEDDQNQNEVLTSSSSTNNLFQHVEEPQDFENENFQAEDTDSHEEFFKKLELNLIQADKDLDQAFTTFSSQKGGDKILYTSFILSHGLVMLGAPELEYHQLATSNYDGVNSLFFEFSSLSSEIQDVVQTVHQLLTKLQKIEIFYKKHRASTSNSNSTQSFKSELNNNNEDNDQDLRRSKSKSGDVEEKNALKIPTLSSINEFISSTEGQRYVRCKTWSMYLKSVPSDGDSCHQNLIKYSEIPWKDQLAILKSILRKTRHLVASVHQFVQLSVQSLAGQNLQLDLIRSIENRWKVFSSRPLKTLGMVQYGMNVSQGIWTTWPLIRTTCALCKKMTGTLNLSKYFVDLTIEIFNSLLDRVKPMKIKCLNAKNKLITVRAFSSTMSTYSRKRFYQFRPRSGPNAFFKRFGKTPATFMDEIFVYFCKINGVDEIALLIDDKNLIIFKEFPEFSPGPCNSQTIRFWKKFIETHGAQSSVSIPRYFNESRIQVQNQKVHSNVSIINIISTTTSSTTCNENENEASTSEEEQVSEKNSQDSDLIERTITTTSTTDSDLIITHNPDRNSNIFSPGILLTVQLDDKLAGVFSESQNVQSNPDVLLDSKVEGGNEAEYQISYTTLNFLLLFYNWSHRMCPKALVKFHDKLTEKVDKVKKRSKGQGQNPNGNESVPAERVMDQDEGQKGQKGQNQDQTQNPSNEGQNNASNGSADSINTSRPSEMSTGSTSSPEPGPDFNILKPSNVHRISFNKIVTPADDNESVKGPFEPVVGGTKSEEIIKSSMKPILKTTEYPIMIDLATLDLPRPNKTSLGKEELAIFSTIFEKIAMTLMKTWRQARGALDILTFPQASSLMEPLSRLKSTFFIIIEAIVHVGPFDRAENLLILSDIKEILGRLSTSSKNACNSAMKFFEEAKSVSDQSDKLFKKKKEFHIIQARRFSRVPIYSDKVPENVTLYEDIIKTPYLFEGVVTYSWTQAGQLTLYTDLANKEIRYDSETGEMDAQARLQLIQILIDTANDLLMYSDEHLQEAISTLDHPIFNEEFPSLVDRLTLHNFDPLQDPLSALELKTNIDEMRQKKEEIVNMAQKILYEYNWIRKFVEDLDHFARINLFTEKKGQKKFTLKKFHLVLCPTLTGHGHRHGHGHGHKKEKEKDKNGDRVTSLVINNTKYSEGWLVEELGRSGKGQISLSYPMNNRIQAQVFKLNYSFSISRKTESGQISAKLKYSMEKLKNEDSSNSSNN